MKAQRTPDVWLERYLLNELPSPEKEQVSQALVGDAALAARLKALGGSNQELLRRLPPEKIARQIARRVESQEATLPAPSLWRLALSPVGVGLLTLVLAAGVTFELFRRTPSEGDQRLEEVVRQKGSGPQVFIFRKTESGAVALAPGSTVGRNEVIQLSYQAAGSRYGAIVSLDGRGIVTQHLPEQGSQAAELSKGSAVPLASAYRLDDAPRMEVFFFVASDRPFPVQVVRDAVIRSGLQWSSPDKRLPLPAAFRQSVFYLEKESSR